MTPLFENEQNGRNKTDAVISRTSPTKRSGAGHWLVAYRKAEEVHCTDVYRRVKETHKRQKNVRSEDKTLDKDLLLRLHCVDEPFELSAVIIPEQNLNDVNCEDLHLFYNVIELDASLNSLSLGHFRSFVSLRELNLSLNRLQGMEFDPDDFPHLEVLDLSYNSVSSSAVAALGRLPRLRVLYLTENQLSQFPSDPSLSNHTSHPTSQENNTHFKSLEVLMLDDNILSSDIFNSLKNLKRLKYLNLKGNYVCEVPLLEMLDHVQPEQTLSEQNKSDSDGNVSENLLKLMQFFQQKDWDDYKETSFPCPELQFLNLSGNKIAEEEALLAVALFPALCEINISSNPLTTRRSGDPPLLTYYLQDKLGVKIKRKNEELKKSTKVHFEPKWKTCEKIPSVLKKTQMLNRQTPDETKTEINEQQTPQPFFVTEIGDLELESAENNTVDLTLVEPIGIQTAVQMLEHTLKNLNVYRDSKPKLDSIQTPYRERAKRIKALLPWPAPPLKQQSKKLDRMIEEIKRTKTMREVPLTKILKREGCNKQDYKEALCLLKDMKDKYKMVHRKTMEQAASLGSEHPTNPSNYT
ncbi:unnamed protein product [Knipowitschia caucasica]|uniref:X-ray radiation resistance-associated protein 1 n=1 Tax=Knipowitschia caucasica TaxID=637954 RepID=A0AAV2JCX7_KNICA